MTPKSRKEKINFLLQNNYYKKLNLYLYLGTVSFIVLVYFFILIFLDESSITTKLLIATLSLLIGIYMVYKKDGIVKHLSTKMEDRKRQSTRREDKEGLSQTIRRIVPTQKKINLNVKPRFSPKEKIEKIKEMFTSKSKKKSDEYIEYKD